MNIQVVDGRLTVLAPAKVNLFLEILGKRLDGYHEIETLMTTLDLNDQLTFAPSPTGQLTLTCSDLTLPTDSENLIVRAAELLKSSVDPSKESELGARIDLKKQIPIEAGLGGGSSDAAATLVGLDRLWSLNTPPSLLTELAGQIGSDVPFFLNAPAAVCRGRGELVEPVGPTHGVDGFHFVLISPPMGIRTADVYAGLTPPGPHASIAPALEAFRSGDPVRLGDALSNRLQPIAERLAPELVQIREALQGLGSSLDGHLMSGSGSTYFGLARDFDAARSAAMKLDALGLGTVRIVRGGL